MSKYKNKKTSRIVNGETIIFDSKAEASRFDELLALSKAGKIKNLTLQPEYQIMDQVRHRGLRTMPRRKYIPDFSYIDENCDVIVEDVKGFKTPTYQIKKQLFLSIYGKKLTFREIN